MKKSFLETSIKINASKTKLWGMFTDVEFTKQMGGEYVSDWKVTSHLRWKGLNGQVLTDGIILEIEPEKLLKHTLLNSGASSDSDIMATLTYEFNEKDGYTTIGVREDFTNPVSEQEHADSLLGWNAALNAAKEIAEK